MACDAASDDAIAGRTAPIVSPDGEDTVEPFLFPFVVTLGNCTGTLISPSHVLTAAHCVNTSVPSSVSFAPRDEDATPQNTFAVVGCWQHEWYIDLNKDYIYAHVLPGLSNDQKAAELSTQCGVLDTHRYSAELNGDHVDLAVLQLERPVPHAGLDPSTISAGQIFVDPVPLVSAPPPDVAAFTGTAVGYGDTGGTVPDSGTRRYKEVSAVMTPGTIRTTVLRGGDSGGPLLVGTPGDWKVLGVASTQEEWASLGPSYKRDWILSLLDRDLNGRVDTYCARRSGGGSDPAANASNDADGDGYLGTVDSCPGTYNPCQERADMDRDGRDDDCDACPTLPSVMAARGTLPDDDMDGYPTVCDCQPTVANRVDGDHDYVSDACDNCLTTPNPFQQNEDDDAFGDVCDRCPDTEDSGSDQDMDGVPDACDNCFEVANAGQLNCNLDAEATITDPSDGLPYYDPEQHKYGRGDVCDPNPCGDTRVRRDDDQYGVEVDGIVDTDLVARTGFRFCRCYGAQDDSLESRIACLDEQPDPDATGSCAISDLLAYASIEEDEHWRQVTLEHRPVGGVDPTLVGSGLREESVLSYTSPGGSFEVNARADWQVATDVARWRSTFSEIVPFGGGGIVPMRGVLWTHTPGEEGADFETEPEAVPTRVLTSHYYSVGLSGPIPFDPRLPTPCARFIGPFFEPSLCPLCGTDGPSPWLVAPMLLDCGFEPEIPPDDWPVIQFRENWLTWDELRDPEWEDPLPPLPECLAPDNDEWLETRWVAASDVHSAGPEHPLRYVRMHLEGATVVRTLLVAGEEGLVSEERANIGEPPPRGGFLAVASASRNQVWMAGGDGYHDVWQYDIASEVWTRLVDDEQLGTILAITYDGVSDRLLVLTAAGAYADLLELAADGTRTTLGTWSRAGAMETFGLAVDPRGNAYITSSNGAEYCAILLRPDEEGFSIHGAVTGEGYVASDAVFGDLVGLNALVYVEGAFRTFEHSPNTFEAPGSWVFEQCM